MNDAANLNPPTALAEIERASREIGFELSSEPLTGSLLRTLAASKPGGHFLEIGTGTGVGSAWLLDGMDAASELISLEKNPDHNAIAHRYLGHDSRATFLTTDAADFLTQTANSFDLIFADSQTGKYLMLNEALALLKPGGLYVVDDLLPKPDLPDSAYPLPIVADFVAALERHPGLKLTKLSWASGLLIAAKVS